MAVPVMYAIVCSKRTSQLWPEALLKLQQKCEGVWPGQVRTVFYQQTSVRSCLSQLTDIKPYYCCFLTHHSECSKIFVNEVNRLTRELDLSNPYTDTIWGVLTGLIEDNVLSALDQEPLIIRRVVANCPVDLEKFKAGVWFSELEQGISYVKSLNHSEKVLQQCPDDTTPLIVQEISDERASCGEDDGSPDKGVDMIISSGHATEDDWNIAYHYQGGKFLCDKGQLYGRTLMGKRIDVRRSRSPKVLSAAGNCLMGHISSKGCMALGWMHSANVVQMIGYVEPTWFGYGGWGVHKYFINNPGSKSLAQSFFANQQSLIHQLEKDYTEHTGTRLKDHSSVYDKCFNTSESATESLSRDCSGLIYDRDSVVFYGDPAWSARLETNHEVYDFM